MKKQPDRYGYCSGCGIDLMVMRVIDGKPFRMFSPEHSETTFKLDDGTLMRVCICKTCKRDMTEKDQELIMNNVKAGWKLEVDQLIADPEKTMWTEEFGKDYLRKYGERSIIGLAKEK